MNLIVGEHSEGDDSGRHTIILEGYGYRWFRVGGLSHILKREKY
jgi:maltose alpha-D-glucosyltransferase/alpha-amylase